MDIDPHITIEESYSDKTSRYTFKKFRFDNINKKIEGTLKTYPSKNIAYKDIKTISDNFKSEGIPKPNIKFFENDIYIKNPKSWNNLKYLLSLGDSKELRTHIFNLKTWRFKGDYYNIHSIVFSEHPLKKEIHLSSGRKEKIKYIEWNYFLSVLHNVSNAIVLVPNIKVKMNIYSKKISRKGKEYLRLKKIPQITCDEFLSFIDYSYSYLKSHNSRAIFVPLSLEWGVTETEKIIKHYADKGYKNIWINFFTKPVGFDSSGDIHFILKIIDKHMESHNVKDPKSTIIYFSHMRREETMNEKKETSNASDILSPFFGADIIGIPRDIPRFAQNDNETPEERKQRIIEQRIHKARIFDASTYYYYKLQQYPHQLPIDRDYLLNNALINKNINAHLIKVECRNIDKYFLDNSSIKNYLLEKKAIIEGKNTVADILGIQHINKNNTLFNFLKSN